MTTATSSRPRAPRSCRSLPTQPHRVRDTAASRIWAAYEQVRAYEPVLRWADVETLHELRIAGKWLRYTLEFVREALGDDAAPLIARVTALQDHLGLMNDADVAGVDGPDVPRRARRRAVGPRERGHRALSREPRAEVARLRRTVGAALAGSRRRQLPTRRSAGSSPASRSLGTVVAGLRQPRPCANRHVRQPRASSARRSRHAGPAWSTARTAPSRTPASETRSDSRP